MDSLSIKGGVPLHGEVTISGAKNANRAAHLADQIVIAHTFDLPRVQRECVTVEFHLGAE